jgi:hypothetical protein
MKACEQELPLTTALIVAACESRRGPGSHMITDRVLCELQRSHQGPHLALIQSFSTFETCAEAWAQWDSPDAVTVDHVTALCSAIGDPDDEDAVCDLPAGHPGAHSHELQYRNAYGRDATPDMQTRISTAAEKLHGIRRPDQ